MGGIFRDRVAVETVDHEAADYEVVSHVSSNVLVLFWVTGKYHHILEQSISSPGAILLGRSQPYK